MSKAQFEELDHNLGNWRIQICTDMRLWKRDDVVYISAEEHRAILDFVRSDLVEKIARGMENRMLQIAGLPIEKIQEMEVDFQGITVIP